MSKLIHFDTFSLPTWAVNFIEYNDAEGLSIEDQNMIVNWQNGIKSTLPNSTSLVYDYGDTEFFSKSPAFGPASECVECNVYCSVS